MSPFISVVCQQELPRRPRAQSRSLRTAGGRGPCPGRRERRRQVDPDEILAGVYSRDSGEVLYNGAPVNLATPRAAQLMSIGIIHQELQLMNHLNVAQNIFIGREPHGRLGVFLDEEKLNRRRKHFLPA